MLSAPSALNPGADDWPRRVQVRAEEICRLNAVCEQLGTGRLDAAPPAAGAAPIEIEQSGVRNVEVHEQPPEVVHMPAAQGTTATKDRSMSSPIASARRGRTTSSDAPSPSTTKRAK